MDHSVWQYNAGRMWLDSTKHNGERSDSHLYGPRPSRSQELP